MNDIIKLTYQSEGEEIKTMEFEGQDNKEFVLSESYPEIGGKHKLVRHGWSYDVYDENNSSLRLNNTINPLYLERITFEDCPECKHISYREAPYRRVTPYPDCPNCTDGRVEVSTGFYSFVGKDEYNNEIIGRIMSIVSEQVIDFSGMEYDKGVDFLKNIWSLSKKRILKKVNR